MEILFYKSHDQHFALPSQSCLKLKPQILRSRISFRSFCAPASVQLSETVELIEAPSGRKSTNSRARVKVSDAQLKDNWLSSLSCPIPAKLDLLRDDDGELMRRNNGSDWVIGIDPDVSGALALLRTDQWGSSAQVFDSSSVQMLIGKRVRKQLDPESIVQLVTSLKAPMGTVAYIEQSTPFPKDGKLIKFADSGLVERRIWVWLIDRDLGCIWILCRSYFIFFMEERDGIKW